jgi:WD40 repeat protein
MHSLGHSSTGSCICEEMAEDDSDGEWELHEDCPVGGPQFGVCSVAFSSDGKRVVAGSVDSSLTVWDTDKGAEVRDGFWWGLFDSRREFGGMRI